MVTLPMIDMEATGRRIIELREKAGFSVKELQEVLGFATPSAIYKWQQGCCMPALDNLIILAFLFGVSMDDIVVLQ